MAETPHASTTSDVPLLHQLLDQRLLVAGDVAGLYGRGALIERLAAFVSQWIMSVGKDDNAEILRFPPLIARKHFEASGYFRNFADLVGTVHCFCGDEETHRSLIRAADAGGNWAQAQVLSDLVMVPAACYPVYPAIAARGVVSSDGTEIDASSYCFRREPSEDPTRMQMFRMHERIFIGSNKGATNFRTRWIGRAKILAALLELPSQIELANDPFFGRVGKIMVRSQRDLELKLELLVPVTSEEKPTACASFNLHLTKMAEAFGLKMENGESAYTACVGFGLERLALAVLRHHGLDENKWPNALRVGMGGVDELLLP